MPANVDHRVQVLVGLGVPRPGPVCAVQLRRGRDLAGGSHNLADGGYQVGCGDRGVDGGDGGDGGDDGEDGGGDGDGGYGGGGGGGGGKPGGGWCPSRPSRPSVE